MTIAGTTATFSGNMPNNVGVGDAIVYGSTYIAFICGRANATTFTVQSSNGGTPQSASAGTSASVYRCYNSLGNWEGNSTVNSNISGAVSGQVPLASQNLVSSNYIMMVPCYADGVDNVSVTETGWTTSSSNYVKIYTPVSSAEVGMSQRHNGTWGNGYRIQGELIIQDNYVWVDGLSIYEPTSNSRTYFVTGQSTTGLVKFSDCFGWYLGTGDTDNYFTFDCWSITANPFTIEWWNCIGINNSSYSNTVAAFYSNGGTGVTTYAYNCTGICPNGRGFRSASVQTATVTNCLGVSGYRDFSLNTGVGYAVNYCASADGTATSYGGSGNRANQTFTFVNSGSNNYLITATDNGARDYGTSLATDPVIPFNYDILGNARPQGIAWDIGANEALEPSAVTITSPVSGTGLGFTYNPHPWIVFTDTDAYQISAARIQISANNSFTPLTTDYWSTTPSFSSSFVTLPCYSTNSIMHTLYPTGAGLPLGTTWYVRALIKDSQGLQSPPWSNTIAVMLSTMTVGMTDPITDGSTPIRAAHFLDLQKAINNVRTLRGSGTYPWDQSWSTLGAGSLIRGVHLNQLRDAVASPYYNVTGSTPVFTNPVPMTSGSLIRGIHLRELRAATTSYP